MGRPLPSVPDLKLVSGGPAPTPGGPAAGARRTGRIRRRRGPGRWAVLGSIAIHVLVLAAFGMGAFHREPPMPELIIYRVELFSPPAREEGPRQPVVSARQPTRAIDRPPEPMPVPRPAPPPPRRPDPPTEPPPEEAPPPRAPDPQPDTRLAGENLDIRIRGEEFPYPEYLQNIMRQVHRYFGAWSGTRGLSMEVYFVIRRDGSVEDIRVLRRSGNVRFDIQAQGAIEAAGRQGALGPLPTGYRADMLPVSIEFQPQ